MSNNSKIVTTILILLAIIAMITLSYSYITQPSDQVAPILPLSSGEEIQQITDDLEFLPEQEIVKEIEQDLEIAEEDYDFISDLDLDDMDIPAMDEELDQEL